MNKFAENFKASVRAIRAYNLRERECRIKLNQNENPYDLPETLKAEILKEFAGTPWNRYPSFYNTGLKAALARHTGLPQECILVGNGSNELLQICLNTVLESGRKLLLVTPTFTVYQQLGRVAGAELCEIELLHDWTFPVSAIIDRVSRQDIAFTILCTPNSPTGSLLAGQDLVRILEAAKGLVLVDEAYHEFAQTDYISLIQKFPNIILTRTFSKAMALAGLRVGYLMADSELVVQINKGKLPYNLNVFSEVVAAKILSHYDYVQDTVSRLIRERQRIFNEMQEIPDLAVYPSSANFLMFSTRLPSQQVLEALLAQEVLIRDISGYHPRLQGMLRLSIGKPEENNTVLGQLHKIFTE